MGEFYEYLPPGPEEQHDRLVALRKLTTRGIPCIMWAEDALCYVYRVATALFDQQILVPDELLETASAILQEGRYVPTVPAWDYAEIRPPNEGASPFPTSIRLRHLDIPDHDPYKLAPLPGYILLLPMSYFALDVRDKARFQSLVPPLDPANSDILVPKYHTFLEGLVHFIMNPPTGLLDNPRPHVMGKSKHDVFIGYLTSWRVFYDYDVALPLHELLPEEQKILDELQTEEARWYMHHTFYKRRAVTFKDMKEYKLQQSKTTSSGPDSTHV
ncbi:hypothetical protein TRAPUB_3150 [Trametes pubescens]|uniref:Uncharacterized protein n=1 Tax=Trametes pubescens TaxID=154538 RepID=A0A1M2VEL3_TRAPU|nr:hypothetical protein TRAPUB_3150 [Trametes pubescens]